MRLHRLTMRNVGPFVSEHTIDFSSLNDSGIFLIEGPTGAGKSTIIDAITFALFGDVAGDDADKSRIRSDRADPKQATEVQLEFSARGRDYTITRSPAYAVPGNKVPRAASQTLIVIDGGAEATYRAARDIGIEVDRALGGIKIDQFRRLVVLPQGEFARLLTASSRENNTILKPLLGDRTIEKVQDLLKVRGTEAGALRAEASATIEREALRVQTRADQAGLEVAAALCDPATLDEARLVIAHDLVVQVDAKASDAATRAAAATESVAELDRLATEAERIAQRADSLASTAAAVASARGRLAEPWSTADASALSDRRSALTDARGQLRPLHEWEQGAGSRVTAVHDKESAVARAKAAYAEADATLSALPAALADLRARCTEANVAAAQLPAAQGVLTSRKDALDAAVARDALRAPVEAAQVTRGQSLDRLAAAVTAQSEANDTLITLQQTQISQSAARLALALKAGDPCLVCGSTEHPAPAMSTDGELVTDADVAAAAERARAAADEVATRRAEDVAAEAALREAQGSLDSAIEKVGGAALEDLQRALDTARADVDAATTAKTRADGLEREITSAEAKVTAAGEERQRAAAARAAAEAELEALVRQHTAEEARHADDLVRLRSALDLTGDTAADLDSSIGTLLADLEAVLRAEQERAEVIAQLEGAEPPVGDPADLRALAAQRRAVHVHSVTEARGATESATTLADALKDLTKHVKDLDEALRTYSEIVATTATAIRLAEISAGQGANTLKMPLSTYAIQLLFEAALDAASHHLREMSSGQYSLELKEEVSRGLGGLEICVHDAWSGTRRDTQTLSGGERFYASLSLAIGLADVVSAEVGGLQLDTLFIDEGFGSLDPETLTIVLEQLDRLKSHGRTIGIISHVTELKEHIHDRIEVRRDEQGNRSISVNSAVN